jgi:hypothetical protein
MRKPGKKTPKGSNAKKPAIQDLTVKDAKAVKGGKPNKYMEYKLTTVIVSSV